MRAIAILLAFSTYASQSRRVPVQKEGSDWSLHNGQRRSDKVQRSFKALGQVLLQGALAAPALRPRMLIGRSVKSPIGHYQSSSTNMMQAKRHRSARATMASELADDWRKTSSSQDVFKLPESFGVFAGWSFKFSPTLGTSSNSSIEDTEHDYCDVFSDDCFPDVVHYVVDPNDPNTGRIAQRMRESTVKRYGDQILPLYEALIQPGCAISAIEELERTIAIELNTTVEVLTGPVYSADDGHAIGFFRIIVVPSERAVAGTFFDSRGILTPLGGLPGIRPKKASFDWQRHERTPHTVHFTIEDLFSPSPNLTEYVFHTSFVLDQRLRDVADGVEWYEHVDDISCPLDKAVGTVAGVVDVYRRADTLVQRRPIDKILDLRAASDLHTRRVYNIVADNIFRKARSEVEPYMLAREEPPLFLVEKYVRLRDANKRCALLRTTKKTQVAIAKRNELKYGRAMGPGSDYKKLASRKGNLNTIMSSFKTAGKDLMLWGNRAGAKVETWEWMSRSVASPWQVTNDMMEAYKRSEKVRVFGFHDGFRKRAKRKELEKLEKLRESLSGENKEVAMKIC